MREPHLELPWSSGTAVYNLWKKRWRGLQSASLGRDLILAAVVGRQAAKVKQSCFSPVRKSSCCQGLAGVPVSYGGLHVVMVTSGSNLLGEKW